MIEDAPEPAAELPEPDRGSAPDMSMAPGGSRALAHGCVCSVLANAGYRAGAADHPFVDPRCPLHVDGA